MSGLHTWVLILRYSQRRVPVVGAARGVNEHFPTGGERLVILLLLMSSIKTLRKRRSGGGEICKRNDFFSGSRELQVCWRAGGVLFYAPRAVVQHRLREL